jgi:hypothetical protein
MATTLHHCSQSQKQLDCVPCHRVLKDYNVEQALPLARFNVRNSKQTENGDKINKG